VCAGLHVVPAIGQIAPRAAVPVQRESHRELVKAALLAFAFAKIDRAEKLAELRILPVRIGILFERCIFMSSCRRLFFNIVIRRDHFQCE